MTLARLGFNPMQYSWSYRRGRPGTRTAHQSSDASGLSRLRCWHLHHTTRRSCLRPIRWPAPFAWDAHPTNLARQPRKSKPGPSGGSASPPARWSLPPRDLNSFLRFHEMRLNLSSLKVTRIKRDGSADGWVSGPTERNGATFSATRDSCSALRTAACAL